MARVPAASPIASRYRSRYLIRSLPPEGRGEDGSIFWNHPLLSLTSGQLVRESGDYVRGLETRVSGTFRTAGDTVGVNGGGESADFVALKAGIQGHGIGGGMPQL